MNLPGVDTICLKRYTFVAGVKIKETGKSKVNTYPEQMTLLTFFGEIQLFDFSTDEIVSFYVVNVRS